MKFKVFFNKKEKKKTAFSLLNQYFVELPFAAIAATNLLGFDSTCFAHPVTEIFVNSSVRLDGKHFQTVVFR